MSQTALTGLPAEDVDAIRRAVDDFVRFMVTGNFEALARMYSEDAVLMPPHHPAIRGRDAIREWMATSPRVTQFTSELEQIEGRADLAYLRGTCVMTVQPEGSAGPVGEIVKYVEIHKRQPDGSWPIVVDIFNSDK